MGQAAPTPTNPTEPDTQQPEQQPDPNAPAGDEKEEQAA